MKLYSWLLLLVVVLSACSKSQILDSTSQNFLQVCTTPWGQFVPEGSKAVAYEKDFAKCGEDCVPVEYDCTGGKLVSVKKNNIAITNPQDMVPIENAKSACEKEVQCSCVLPAGKGVVSNGVKTTVYSSASAACGDTCDSKKIDALCKNGTFVNPITLTPLTNANFSCSVDECKSCVLPWDQTKKVTHGATATGYINATLGCGLDCQDTATNAIKFSCSNGVLTKIGALPNTPSTLKNSCEVSQQCSCTTADNNTYTHNTTTVLKLYPAKTGTCATPCTAGDDYKCLQNKFTKVSTGLVETANVYKTCTDTCVYCPLPDGSKLEQGKSVTLSKTTTGSCSVACVNATFTCDAATAKLKMTNGTGQVSDYTAMSCTDTCVRCALPDGTQLDQGQTRTFYNLATADCSQTCKAGVVQCDAATKQLILVSGDGTAADYTKTTCTNNCKYCTLSDGTKMQQNTSNIKYLKASVKCGESCDAKILQCDANATLSILGGGLGKPEDYVNSTCIREACRDCSLPWSTTVKLANTAKQVRYTKGTAPCGETCDMSKVEVTCNDSNLLVISGSPSADLSTSVASCSADVCATCSFDGKTLNEGARVTTYRNDGTNCAASACADYISRTCHNGSMDGDSAYIHSSCQNSCVTQVQTETGRTGDASLEGGGANPWLCPVLHSNGQAFGGTKLTYYTKSTVACADSCNNYKVTVECNNLSGLFSNSNQMLYLNCKEKCP